MIAKNQVWQNKHDSNDLILIKQNYHKAVSYSILNDDTVETMSTLVLKNNYQCVGKDGIKSDNDMVNNPPHYQDASGVECIEITKHMQFCGGNCFKYLYRAGDKGDLSEDLLKAKWYAERAWMMNEEVPEQVYDLIGKVAKNKSPPINQFMTYVKNNQWLKLEREIHYYVEFLKGMEF